MNIDTVLEIERLAKAETQAVVEVEGKKFLGGKEVRPDQYFAQLIQMNDLASFANIIKAEQKKFSTPLCVSIDTEISARCYTILDDKLERQMPYSVIAILPSFKVGDWYDYEQFIIGVRSKFVANEDRDNLIKLVAGVVHCDEQKLEDNGVTQSVSIKSGTKLQAQAEVKSIVKLKPYRTFIECEQPESEFLFRISNNGTRYGLFEADGGKWRLQAKLNVKKHLDELLKDTGVITLA